MTGCTDRIEFPAVIIGIGKDVGLSKCDYFVETRSLGSKEFLDSCGKFKVGDTVKVTK